MINNYYMYIILAITITAIPGPAVVLTIKNSIKYGYKTAMMNILGNFFAMIILATISAVGLGAIILASSTLFFMMKIAGCFYLIYLGIKAWQSPYEEPLVKEDDKSKKELLSIFKEGFFIGISNPKAIAFLTALFPQFIDPSRAYTPQFLTLIFTIEGISCLILSIYALLCTYASPFLSRKRPMMFFNKLTGFSFVGFGVALISND